MGHRVFLAINLPEDLKSKLFDWRKLHQQLAVRWTKPAGLHITLVFIGYVTDDQLWQICQIVREVASVHHPFFIKLNKILPGPPGRPPRMIWVEGKISQELAKLKEDLDRALLEKPWGGSFRKENRSLRPHVTLARFYPQRFRPQASLSLLEEKFDCIFFVNSVELMESDLKHDGAEYSVLESFELGG